MDRIPQQADLPIEHGLSRPWKVAYALVGAAVVPAVLGALVVELWFASMAGNSEMFSLSGVPGDLFLFALSCMVAMVITSAHVLVLAFPLFLLGAHFRMIRWWSCLIISFVVGILPSLLLGASGSSNQLQIYGLLGVLGLLGMLGMSGGLTFWLLWHFWIDRPGAAPPVPII